MEIKTNNVPRDILYWEDLTPTERLEFDYLHSDDLPTSEFVRYKGVVYSLDEFSRITTPIAPHPQRPGWEEFDGYASDSYFSGVLVKMTDSDQVVMATYFC